MSDLKSIGYDRQVQEVIKLLIIWPMANYSTIQKYIEDTLEVTPTRVCIQEAKKELGLAEPNYEEKTREKRLVARYIMHSLVASYGLGGRTEAQFVSQTHKSIKAKFNEDTNHRLLQGWVKEVLTELNGKPLSDYPSLVEQAKAELSELKILKEGDSRQMELL